MTDNQPKSSKPKLMLPSTSGEAADLKWEEIVKACDGYLYRLYKPDVIFIDPL